MYCYNCGCLLSEHDYCTACGADVGLYKKIMYASNRFYDDGLDKAEVRDLSGAVISLRQSLKFNKNNIEARNLLGLVYFEMGETVAAMAEWVISKNLRPEKNIADDYIGILEENAGRMSVIYETIEGYNKAYEYCLQDAKDLAIIQLKSVLSKNTKFVKAHQLLALLYLDAEDYQKAERELEKTLAIDKNNTLSLKYLKEVEDATGIEETAKQTRNWRKNNDSVRVMHDNEMIIQPANVKEPKSGGGFSTFINIGIGMLIGLAVMYFLVVPGRMTAVRNQANDNIAQIGEEIDSKNVEIQSLEADIRRLEDENATLKGELEGYVGDDGTLSTIDNLLDAAQNYITEGDVTATGEKLEAVSQAVNVETSSEAFKSLYNSLLTIVGPQLADRYYNDGYAAFRNAEYNTAIELLEKAVYYNENNSDAIYNLANAYKAAGENDKAVDAYNRVIELFPDDARAGRSKRYIEEISAGGSVTN